MQSDKKIIGKANIDSIHDVIDEFEQFELFVPYIDQDWVDKLLKLPKGKVYSIHTPSKVKIGSTFAQFNLCESPGYQKSWEDLRTLINACNKQQVDLIVIHGALRPVSQDHEQAIEQFAEEIDNTDFGTVQISFENDAVWYNRVDPHHALLCTKQDFTSLFKNLKTNAGICLDFQHIELTHMYNKANIVASDFDEFEQLYTDFVAKDDTNEYYDVLNEFVKEHEQKINHIHVCGSDCHHFIRNNNTFPLQGEHLPLTSPNNKYDMEKIAEVIRNLDAVVCIEIWDTERLNEFMIADKKYLASLL